MNWAFVASKLALPERTEDKLEVGLLLAPETEYFDWVAESALPVIATESASAILISVIINSLLATGRSSGIIFSDEPEEPPPQADKAKTIALDKRCLFTFLIRVPLIKCSNVDLNLLVLRWFLLDKALE